MKILIAGASGGLGRYLSQALREQGHEVYGTFNTNTGLNSKELPLEYVDITNEQLVAQWIDSKARESNELVLIDCVGINYNCSIHKSDTDRWMDVIRANLGGAYYLIKHILPYMREKRFGRIILFSSVVPQMGVPGTSAYSASKSGLWGLAKTVAIENAKYGITINTVNLGYYDVGMIKDVPPDLLEKIKEKIPCGKLGDPINILNVINMLLLSDYINGTQIDANGGIY
ncbi:MAG TPA: SDR family oxidoreductase [Candidatus Cloacimonadota bacterium]|nr:SDR family oxidoreductase [Candidatus Cloacimonadota bacterium]